MYTFTQTNNLFDNPRENLPASGYHFQDLEIMTNTPFTGDCYVYTPGIHFPVIEHIHTQKEL